MAREPTNPEKAVFGQNCKIDPKTNLPIERGFGAPSRTDGSHQVAKERAERAAHTREIVNAARAEERAVSLGYAMPGAAAAAGAIAGALAAAAEASEPPADPQTTTAEVEF